ncbi:MAG: barstar family protein [Bacteroidota bacterium]
MREFIIEGSRITTAKSFFKEIERELLVDSSGIRRWSLDVFDDILLGGYGLYNLNEEFRLVWRNYKRSQARLNDELLDSIVEILNSHEHIELVLD